MSGKIDSGILVTFADVDIDELIVHLKNKNFKEVRDWANKNWYDDTTSLLRRIYEGLSKEVDGPSIAHVVLIVAKYDYQSAYAADRELNLLAALTEMMVECNFK